MGLSSFRRQIRRFRQRHRRGIGAHMFGLTDLIDPDKEV